CDFAIADLTYARPSVYFEAGFAQREVPVIYTCRGDHFKYQSEDSQEHHRVHFDLQMKNIIRWSSARDADFARKLAKRISVVIRPILAALKTEQTEKRLAETFTTLPMKERVASLLDASVRQLKRAQYRCRKYLGSETADVTKIFHALWDHHERRHGHYV